MKENRELKFRAWNRATKLMYLSPSDIRHLGSWFDAHLPGALSALEYISIMQFTGLKDKNGVEIYEGDIINQFNLAVRRTVVFVNGAFGYYTGDDDYKEFISFAQNQWYKWEACVSNEIEVIGNIYENSDLLAAKPKAF